jgi:ataxia telangiectasia mutated family protein
LEVVVHRGQLFVPVALDYIKSIKTIVGFQPHMDHLEDNNWVSILELAFNVVLRDPLRRRLDIDDEDDYSDDSDDPQDNDVVDVDMEAQPSTSAAQSRKRRRNGSPAPSYSVKSQRRVPVAASNEQVEFASIIYILLRVRSTPLLSKAYPSLAAAVLKRLRRFLTIYPTDSSLHRDYLLTVSATLSHLSLNRKRDVEAFARYSWPDLVDLWGTGAKSPWIKEALVPVFRALFPFLTAVEPSSKMWKGGVSKLWYLLEAESENRWGVDGLSLESLRLETTSLREYDDDPQPFIASTFQAGWHFDSKQALAWAILELQADCTAKVRPSATVSLDPYFL